MRAVVDTNVLISALFWGGTPRRVVDLAATGRFRAVTSPELLGELETVLAEDFGLPQEKVELVLRDILSYAEVITPVAAPEVPVRDLSDAKVLACAVAAGADCIVTGDQDLLSLGSAGDISIITPRAFLDLHPW
jgi:putative PIN family toxin of toxin-antitoxin system